MFQPPRPKQQSGESATPEPGSFRDPGNRVFYRNEQVLRALDAGSAAHWHQLRQTAFFRALVERGDVVATETEHRADARAETLTGRWSELLRHERIPFISYPYEWTFSMLKDAALLHLRILEDALENGWTMKDGSAYNIQWRGQRPVFIDVSSFEPYSPGDSWLGYRQFCMMFLIPLLLKAHRDINTASLCRSDLEGIDPEEALKFVSVRDLFRRGVLSHIYLHARLQAHARRADAAAGSAASRWTIRQTRDMTLRMVQSLKRLVQKLERPGGRTLWSSYEETHSYDETSFAEKKDFVERHVRSRRWPVVYDLGCNTGTFSRLCSEQADCIIAIDQDELAIDKLYRRLKTPTDGNITPLVMQLSNTSPDQGWRGRERKSFERRASPDLILCLALIHHLIISANIPLRDFLEWIRDFGAIVILEFVGPEDEMTLQLLRNRRTVHPDYTQEQFEAVATSMFDILDSAPLKSGRRRIYLLQPKAQERPETIT